MSERWKITEHARGRMHEMSLTRHDVMEVLAEPIVDYPSSDRAHPPGRRICVRGRLAVVYERATRRVVTVLWNGIDFVRPRARREDVSG